jgi:hypothetical protein
MFLYPVVKSLAIMWDPNIAQALTSPVRIIWRRKAIGSIPLCVRKFPSADIV